MSSTINTIPASTIVSVVPSVVSAGGSALDLIELMLTTNSRVQIPSILSFPTLASVQDFFGATSDEAAEAAVYFAGFVGATKLPGALLFAQYPIASVGGYLRGGDISGLTLAQLQAISGVLTVSIDGTPVTSSSINFSAATSFSNAAQLVTTALGTVGPNQAVVTGSMGAVFTATATGTSLVVTAVTGVIHPGSANSATITGTGVPANSYITAQVSGTTGGAGTYTTNQATTASAAAITCTSTTLDVTAVASGTVAIGQEAISVGVTAGTYVTALGTGTGGVGTYVTTTKQHVASASIDMDMPTVTYDSVSGAFLVVSGTTGASSSVGYGSGTISTAIKLTAAAGAVTSAGSIAGVPSTFMAAVIAQTTNWATFQTLFDPDAGSGNTQKQLFAAWVNSTDNRYAYLATDTDVTPTQSTAATGSLGYILNASDSSGTVPIYEPVGTDLHLAAFLGGFVASLDFTATNGRATAAFREQTGIVPSATNATVAANLIANDYNFYGSYATANDTFNFFYPGQITGPYSWFDSYVNQIWFNNECQLALMSMLVAYKSIPYDPVGYGYIRAALADPIAAALNFGAIRPNVPLSAAQASEVNALAGRRVDGVLGSQGWYLVIQAASAQTRAARQSPTIILLYMDGESVQKMNLSSVLVQ